VIFKIHVATKTSISGGIERKPKCRIKVNACW